MTYGFLRLPVKLKKWEKFVPLVFKKVIYPESMKPLLILYTIIHLGEMFIRVFFSTDKYEYKYTERTKSRDGNDFGAYVSVTLVICQDYIF